MNHKPKTLKIHPLDNVLVALSDLEKGARITLDQEIIQLVEYIKAKHKVAIKDFEIDEEVLMYGVVVGRATAKILKGAAISNQNITHETQVYTIPKTASKQDWSPPLYKKYTQKEFLGYHREDGKVGTENNWLVIPLVFCQNRNVE